MYSFTLAVQPLPGSYCWKLLVGLRPASWAKPYSTWDEIYLLFCSILFQVCTEIEIAFLFHTTFSHDTHSADTCFKFPENALLWVTRDLEAGFQLPDSIQNSLIKKLIITKSNNNSNCTMSTYFSTQRVQVLLFFRPLISDQKGLTTEAVSKYDINYKGWKTFKSLYMDCPKGWHLMFFQLITVEL